MSFSYRVFEIIKSGDFSVIDVNRGVASQQNGFGFFAVMMHIDIKIYSN